MLTPGRFDFHVQLAAPAAAERGALLKHEIQKRSLLCSDDVLLDIASSCDGYDAYDLVFEFFLKSVFFIKLAIQSTCFIPSMYSSCAGNTG